jgi:hypothetical protein
MMRRNGVERALWSAVRSPARTCRRTATIFTIMRKSCLFSGALACVLGVSWAAQAGSSYLAVWSSDNETDGKPGVLNTDFLAIIDADPKSRTYGKVVNTASMESVPGANLLNDLGLTEALGLTSKYGLTADGIPSDALNEAHHMTHDPIVVGNRSYLFMGGLISANIFRCDVTDPLRVPTCPLVTSAKDVNNFSGIDDFLQAPNGNVLVTYMGAKDLTTPGGVVEIGVDGKVFDEYAAAKPGGPMRYIPSVRKDHETDTGLLAHPHGIDARPDLDLLVTSDYADPLTLATSPTLQGENEDCGTTVRFWKLSDLKAGPTAIAQLPVGKGREAYFRYNAPEGVMSVALTHLYGHKGVFATTMAGGTIWYAPDATVAEPEFRMIYRIGPGASAPVFFVTPDDRFLVHPIQGVLSSKRDTPPVGPSVFNRDYPGEHSRRVIVLDIQKLLAQTHVKCDAPPVEADANGIIQHITARNNGADDCPTVTGTLNLDSPENFKTHSGPHFVAFDHETRRVAASNYFVQLTPFALPGLHEDGDHRVCMARLTQTGQLILDQAFKDELNLTAPGCIAMDRPASYHWPNRGRTGAAKPHAMAFINFDEDQAEDPNRD